MIREIVYIMRLTEKSTMEPTSKYNPSKNTTPSIPGLYRTLFELDNVTIPEEGDTLFDPFTEYLLKAAYALQYAFISSHAIHTYTDIHRVNYLVFGSRDMLLPKKQKYQLDCNPRTETKNNCKKQLERKLQKKRNKL